jgi:hypothetical protein
MTKAKKAAREKTPREIQMAELRRRRANWKTGPRVPVGTGPGEHPRDADGGARIFVREVLPASPARFCWFCFESDRELHVADITGVCFCKECASSLLELATYYVPDQDELIGPLVNACAAALPIVEAGPHPLIAAQLKFAIQLTAEWFDGACPEADPAWSEADAAEMSREPRQPELPLEDLKGPAT